MAEVLSPISHFEAYGLLSTDRVTVRHAGGQPFVETN